MILIMFGIGVLFMLILLFIGATQYSFPFLYLGFFCMLMLGMFIMSEGISLDDGIAESSPGVYTTVWDIHTMANDPMINMIGNTFFYLPIGMILLTTFVALRR